MKIGIIVHSQTGHTLGVAQKLKERLIASGHEVNVEQVTAYDDDQMEADKVSLKSAPDINKYDALILGAPVRGFSLSAVMKAYISRVGTFSGKKVAFYITHAFPFPAMGGKQAIDQAVRLCEAHGAKVSVSGIISRSNINCRKNTENLLERFSGIF